MKAATLALIASTIIGLAHAQFIQPQGKKECLYCKNMDTVSGFLYYYSYCADKNICVADAWSKMNMWCDGGWTEGYMLDIDQDCDAQPVREVKFISSESYIENPIQRTVTL